MTITATYQDGQIALSGDQPWAVEVDVRPAHSRQSWTPIALMGGSFEVRT